MCSAAMKGEKKINGYHRDMLLLLTASWVMRLDQGTLRQQIMRILLRILSLQFPQPGMLPKMADILLVTLTRHEFCESRRFGASSSSLE